MSAAAPAACYWPFRPGCLCILETSFDPIRGISLLIYLFSFCIKRLRFSSRPLLSPRQPSQQCAILYDPRSPTNTFICLLVGRSNLKCAAIIVYRVHVWSSLLAYSRTYRVKSDWTEQDSQEVVSPAGPMAWRLFIGPVDPLKRILQQKKPVSSARRQCLLAKFQVQSQRRRQAQGKLSLRIFRCRRTQNRSRDRKDTGFVHTEVARSPLTCFFPAFRCEGKIAWHTLLSLKSPWGSRI